MKNNSILRIEKIIKFLFIIAKKSIHFLEIMFCIYLIFLTLQDLNILIFHSYKTSALFDVLYDKGFFDLDLIVKYSEHYWDIIAKSLVVWLLLFCIIIPYVVTAIRSKMVEQWMFKLTKNKQ